MSNLTIRNDCRVRKEWIDMVSLPDALKTCAMEADVLIVPSMMPTQPKAFVVGASHLFAFLQSQFGEGVEICIRNEEYEDLELNSRTVRLGRFIVKSIVLSLFLSILGNYIYDRIREPYTIKGGDDLPEYQKPADVSFTIAVEDSTGKKKNFSMKVPHQIIKLLPKK